MLLMLLTYISNLVCLRSDPLELIWADVMTGIVLSFGSIKVTQSCRHMGNPLEFSFSLIQLFADNILSAFTWWFLSQSTHMSHATVVACILLAVWYCNLFLVLMSVVWKLRGKDFL